MKISRSLFFRLLILAMGFALAYPLFFSPFVIQAQDRAEDTVRVRTSEVLIDTLIKDKKTGATVEDLMPDDFEVLADGKPRSVSYFNRPGETRRCPLALMVLLDLVSTDVGKYLRRPETLESLNAALKNPAPEDEAAIYARVGGSEGNTMRIYTRPRKMSAALASVPNLLGESKPDYYIYQLNGMLEKINSAVQERPNSQIVVVGLASDVAPIAVADRDEVSAKLIHTVVAYNPFVVETDKKFLALRPLLEATGRIAGADNYGAAHRRTDGRKFRESANRERFRRGTRKYA